MKYVFLNIIVLSIVISCKNGSSYQTQESNERRDSTNEILKSTKDIVVKSIEDKHFVFQKNEFNKDNQNITSDSASLQILLNNSKSIIFKNENNPEDETSIIHYSYNGFEKVSQLHWITKELYEEQKQLLVDNETGESVEIWNEPLVNTNATFLLTFQNPCFRTFEECPAGFQIWKVVNGKVSLFYQVKLDEYYVSEGGWISNNELVVKLNTRNLDHESVKDKHPYSYLVTIQK